MILYNKIERKIILNSPFFWDFSGLFSMGLVPTSRNISFFDNFFSKKNSFFVEHIGLPCGPSYHRVWQWLFCYYMQVYDLLSL